MEIYFTLLLLAGAPASDPVIARDIHSKPVPLWESSKGLVDDRPSLGYALPQDAADRDAEPSLAYDLTGLERSEKGRKDRHEVAFEEAIDMARQAREEIAADPD